MTFYKRLQKSYSRVGHVAEMLHTRKPSIRLHMQHSLGCDGMQVSISLLQVPKARRKQGVVNTFLTEHMLSPLTGCQAMVPGKDLAPTVKPKVTHIPHCRHGQGANATPGFLSFSLSLHPQSNHVQGVHWWWPGGKSGHAMEAVLI